jgi:septal ring factor EnvC (AmiA/AmiB activator)
MNTDTPRTEAARFEALRSSAFRQDCIPLKLGQELERELAASKAEVARLRDENKELRDENKELRDENKELRDENKELRKLMRRSIDLTDKILGELPPPFPFEWFVDMSEKASAIDEKYSYLLK